MRTTKLLLMAFGLLCSLACSAYGFEVDGLYYNIISTTDLTCEITSGDNKYTGEVVIPCTVTYKNKTLQVVKIGSESFKLCSHLTSVTIPTSVITIGECAFSGSSSLTNITIPNSVTTIEGLAFHYCSKLANVIIPNSVTSIGYAAFHGCI